MKWPDKHPRKKPRFVEIDGKGAPMHCERCKRSRFFQKTENGNYRCPRCDTVFGLD